MQNNETKFFSKYTSEIFILIVFLGVGIISQLIGKAGIEFRLCTIVLGIFSYITLIIEHKTILIIDKDNNLFKVITKALFFNKYWIKEQLPFDSLDSASVYRSISSSHSSTGRRTSQQFELFITMKNGYRFSPFGFSSSDGREYYAMADKINAFIKNTTPESFKQIEYAPFAFRLIGLCLACVYFYMCIQLCPNALSVIGIS